MGSADPTHASIPPAPLPTVGEIVADKYRIDRMIAEGGMGVVYEARHIQLDEPVAIKFLRPDFAGTMEKELAGRFIREARASAKIRSEHVTRVHDVGTLPSGAPYIVMEKLTGDDLEQLVEKNGVLSIERAIDYVLQACEALAEAHAIGIVHRDLKPANLFLTHRADGSSCVKVLDFGISKFKDASGSGSEMGITKTHAVMGSPRYMSPEQMRSSKDVDARADVWAIGIILYELFAGTVPFDGESMPQICAAILQDEPKALRALRPEVSPALDAVVLRCLAKKAADRYESIAPLATELAEFGSAAARVSARRIGRVLGASGPDLNFNADTVPHDFPPPADSGRLPSIRVHQPGPNVSSGNATAVAWTGIEPPPPQKRRRTALLIAAALAFLGIGAGGAIFHDRSKVTAAGATATERPTPNDPITASAQPLAQPDAVTPTPMNSAAVPIAPADAANAAPVATNAKMAAGKKPPVARPPAHSAATHAGSTSANANAASTPNTTSQPTAAPSDMWGGRK